MYLPSQQQQITIQIACRSVEVEEGESFFLWLEVEGEHPMDVRWTRDGRPVANQTDVQLHAEAAKGADAGDYVCTVTNQQGSLTSEAATVSVRPRSGNPCS